MTLQTWRWKQYIPMKCWYLKELNSQGSGSKSINKPWCNSVSIVTRLQSGQQENRGLITCGGRGCALHQCIQTDSEVHLASYPMVSLEIKQPEHETDPSPPLGMGLILHEAISPLSPYIIMSWDLIKHWNNFILQCDLRFLTVANIKTMAFWGVTPCILVEG